MIPGRIENLQFVINLAGQGVTSMPVGKIKTILRSISSQHKCVARTIYILNAPMTITVLWQAVRFLLDETTSRKVQIINNNSCPDLVRLTAPNQLEEKFGGTAENKTSFWPPSLPDDEFGVGGQSNISGLQEE